MFFDYFDIIEFILSGMYFTTSLCLILSGVIFFSENSIYSTFSLLITVLLVAITMLLCGIEFLAVMYVFVYAGAVVVTFLFVIMSVNLRREDTVTSSTRLKKLIPAFICTMFFIFLFSYFLFSFNAQFEYVTSDYRLDTFSGSKRVQAELYLSDIMIFNTLLYTQFAPYLLLLGLLLLVSVVGAVSLSLNTASISQVSDSEVELHSKQKETHD